MDFTQQDAETLGDKLDALDLTDGERAALVAVFEEAAEEDEVGGFVLENGAGKIHDMSFKARIVPKSFGSTTGDGPSGF